MTTIDRDRFVTALDDVGGEDALYERYSGRGMYGRECVGMRLDSVNDLLVLGAALQEVFGDVSDFTDVRTDSLGLGVIVYWPGLTLEEDE